MNVNWPRNGPNFASGILTVTGKAQDLKMARGRVFIICGSQYLKARLTSVHPLGMDDFFFAFAVGEHAQSSETQVVRDKILDYLGTEPVALTISKL